MAQQTNSEAKTQEQRILWALQAAFPWWVPAPALGRISLQYGARVHSLRRKGWLIVNRVRIVDGQRHGEFRLGTAAVPPSKELRQHPTLPAEQTGSLFPDLAPETMGHRDDG
jgi:hypothetical protein